MNNADKLRLDELINDFRGTQSNQSYLAIVELLKTTISCTINRFRVDGYDKEDLQQICLMKLREAIFSYNPDKGASFPHYAQIFMRNGLHSLSTRKVPPMFYVDDYVTLDTATVDPLTSVIEADFMDGVLRFAKTILTPLEYRVFSLSFRGYRPLEIFGELKMEREAVYNAIKRAKTKLKNNRAALLTYLGGNT